MGCLLGLADVACAWKIGRLLVRMAESAADCAGLGSRDSPDQNCPVFLKLRRKLRLRSRDRQVHIVPLHRHRSVAEITLDPLWVVDG